MLCLVCSYILCSCLAFLEKLDCGLRKFRDILWGGGALGKKYSFGKMVYCL